jgi:cohesin complex subunit SA-1/2
LKELGVWIETYPSLYGDEVYLGYFIRGCNDPVSAESMCRTPSDVQDQHARFETVKALASLYGKESFANTVSSGTNRLASRLIEMSLRDIDTPVRVRALQTITLIDATGFLEDEEIEERNQVSKLLFDSDQKVRRAVGGYVSNIWKQRAERLCSDSRGSIGNKKKRVAEAGGQDTVEAYLGCKALIRMAVETSAMLDQEQGRERYGADESGSKAGSELVAATTASEGAITRAIAVVESLDIPPLQDYNQLAEYLLLDHSGHGDDAWLLNEEEEAFGLQIMCACIALEVCP